MKTNSTTTESAGPAHAQGSFFAGKDQPAAPFFGASLIQRKLQEAQDSPSSGLDSETRPALEGFLNHDLSHVQVHNNSASHEASSQIQAKAYTTGSHIFMGSGTGSMSPVQRKALLAHEVVHTIQQKSIAPGTVQAKPEIGEANSSHEAEADNIAQAFVQSQATGYRSPGLQMRSNLAISPVSRPAIQRLPKTWGGEWFPDSYSISSTGTRRSVKMDLRFKPGIVADAELIGLVQEVRSYKNKKAYYINNDAVVKAHSIQAGAAIEIDPATKETDEGAHIDRLKDKNNPVYGTESLLAGEGMDKSVSNGNSVQGWHYTDKASKLQEKDASLSDETGLNDADKDSGQIFETAALGLKGNQVGSYYGSVRWGWRTDNKSNFTKIDPVEVVSQGVPSSTFMKSAEIWNAGKDSGGGDTVNLPIVDVKKTKQPVTLIRQVPFANITLPAGTRVQQLFDFRNLILQKIRVVDGPHTGIEGHVNFIEWTPAHVADERS